ncbi:alpha/beta hydrolase [Tsukamurella sp. PLM1]|uniref:alpha/beta hydrolase n=1 Tax=Tsukamurella sp. PLM1 TaxID=2929795 RepID=UPI0020BDA2AA|nr:alpha/beta hydrolase [Tsukamurella sp. PLM1]
MDFAVCSLAESVSKADAAATREFYAARPVVSAMTSHAEVVRARASRDGRIIGSSRAEAAQLDVGGRTVAVRIIEPRHRPITGVLLHLPGGGFYLSSAVADDERNVRRADATGLVVISVDYRLAPEHPWPAAPDDCAAAAEWLITHSRIRFGTDRLLLSGFSAGATLAAATLLRLRDDGTVRAFHGAVLEAGTYDLTAHCPSGAVVVDDYFVEAYAGHVEDRAAPDVSPAYGDLRGLPPTLMVVGADDVVLPDNLLMAARLSAAGNDIALRIYPDVPHGFSNHPTPVGRTAALAIDTWLRNTGTAR